MRRGDRLPMAVCWAVTAPVLLGLAVLACSPTPPPATPADSVPAMDRIADEYVRLVLELGVHDEGYVDAYYGPEELREAAEASPRSIEEIARRATELAGEAAGTTVPAGAADAELLRLRRGFLAAQLSAVAARARILGGEGMGFDAEARALYDAEAPHHGEAHYEAILEEIDRVVPGEGPLAERWAAWRERFVVPPERLAAVFDGAIAECRRRTAERVELPEGEGFRVEYVTDKPWSGYNWYQGGYQSLIQVNTDLPIHIDRAVDLACHEGYPGHHAYNALLEENLVRDRGWAEYSVYPLYSPQSLIAEGTANFGIRVAFPGEERAAFERDVLFPLAGLDPAQAADYYRVAASLEKLSYAGNEAARRYLDGEIDRDAAERWLTRFTLSPPDRAAQRVRFFDAYRSYVINYNLGQDVVRRWVEAHGGTADRPERRWELFEDLLTTPRVPSTLVAETAAAE